MDNCRVHTKCVNEEFLEAAKNEGLNVCCLKLQPVVSPDFNVLDLGFFTSIQNLKEKMDNPKDLDELISCVNSAFKNQPCNTLDKVFLSLQCAMMDSLSVYYGSNSHKLVLGHMGKKEKFSMKKDCFQHPWNTTLYI